jgi:hypothetical protein
MTDFAYGCIDTGTAVEFVCGNGPGTACDSSAANTCVDSDVIDYCRYGKLTEDSCLRICQEEGDSNGASYDFGSCGDQDGTDDCLCCDLGDPGCGDGGGTSSGSDTGTTG